MMSYLANLADPSTRQASGNGASELLSMEEHYERAFLQ